MKPDLTQIDFKEIDRLRELQKSLAYLDNYRVDNITRQFHEYLEGQRRRFGELGRAMQAMHELPKIEPRHASLLQSLSDVNWLDPLRRYSAGNRELGRLLKEVSDRQAEFLKGALAPLIAASTLRQPEIEAFLRSPLQSVTGDFSRILNELRLSRNIDVLRDSYAGKLTEELREILETVRTNDARLTRIEEIIDRDGARDKESGMSRYELIMLILGILMILGLVYQCVIATLQYQDQKQHNAQPQVQAESIAQLRQEVVQTFQQFLLENAPGDPYFVNREAAMMSGLSFKSQRVGTLLEGSRVECLSRNHKWVFVRGFDAVSGSVQYGWVNKKYLTRVK